MQTTYIGMDLHATTSVLEWLDGEGQRAGYQEVVTHPDSLQKAIRKIPAGCKKLVFEQNCHSTWAADALGEWVDELYVSDPRYNDRISKAKHKDDETDAGRLAELLYENKIHQLYVPAMDQRLIFRKQYIYYERRRKEATRAIQKLISQLRYWGVRISTEEAYAPAKAPEWLGKVPTAIRPNIEQLHQAVLLFNGQAEQAWERVTESGVGYPEIREFKKIFGVGPKGSHGLSAYIMDPHRFRTASQLYAYSKLAVRHHSSQGKRVRREKLIPAGHGSLKAITHRAVTTALRHPGPDNEVWKFYQASLGRSDSEKNARLNTQRKILKTAWSIWKHNDEYRPARFVGQMGRQRRGPVAPGPIGSERSGMLWLPVTLDRISNRGLRASDSFVRVVDWPTDPI